MENIRDAQNFIEKFIEPNHPETAKLLKLLTPLAIITAVSILVGTVGSLIVRSFTDERPEYVIGWIFWFSIITAVMYVTLQIVRFYQLFSRNGVLNDPKYKTIALKHIGRLLKSSTGKFAIWVASNAIIVAFILLAFDFEIKVQIGSWITAIDSRAFALATVAVYFMDVWYSIGSNIKDWVKCREFLDNVSEVL